jgi:hypothetical protein
MSWTITPQTKVPVDPFRSQVSLLLHGNGTNGSTTITDNSPSPKTVTVFGDAKISTAQSKFGGSSIAFDGTGDYLQIANNSAFNFETNSFTVEAWVYFNNVSGQQCLFTNYQNSTNGWALQLAGSAAINANLSGDGFDILGSTAISANTWYHIALSGTSASPGIKLFINGIQEGFTYTGATALNTTTAFITGSIAGSAYFNGYIDDLRITKGVARYTANFTPPAAPFPDI